MQEKLGMKVKSVSITPELAKEWLATVPEFQRKVRQHVVDRYASDMEAGAWHSTHQGIAFDTNGRLIDGQHRLAAIVKYGLPILMVVFTNVPERAFENVDIGFGRTNADVFAISGDKWITTEHVAMARLLSCDGQVGGQTANRSPAQIREAVEEHKSAINFVIQNLERRIKAVTTAPVLAAIAAAFYHESDKVLLARFVRVLVSGVTEDRARDPVVIVLREWLRDNPGSGNASFRRECYLKTQRVIRAYMKGERLMKLYVPSEPIYSLAA